jgi:hypothetical protein
MRELSKFALMIKDTNERPDYLFSGSIFPEGKISSTTKNRMFEVKLQDVNLADS